MSAYEPELGQMAFGQPWQPQAVSGALEHALDTIRDAFARTVCMGDMTPMDNSGERYDGKCFTAHCYSWSDDDQPFNFAWRDLRVSWYKYLGRGMSCNRNPDAAELAEMVGECVAELEAA